MVLGIIHDGASFAPSRIPAWVRAECSTRVYFIIHHGPPSSARPAGQRARPL